ncbi:WD40 repeat domain-containing protein [Acetobacteraceae bacterium KSS8]|uniref:WD40 repeat domain-containing protein n=1 Tax=Endosaccharibacter trunci TaxID=2812733 RepID=A0ABT1W6Q1_9PROT|nr:WD40 repeat domain-containing protein [Acetobacteraceae bacterium KSS8]
MSGAAAAAGSPALAEHDHLLRTRGVEHALDGFVSGCAFSRDGRTVCFATAEGRIALAASDGGAWREIEAHDGSILSLAPDAGPSGFVSGGDDTVLNRIDAEGGVAPIAKGRRWIEHVASFPGKPGSGAGGLIASAAGKQVELRDAAGTLVKTLEHPSTVSGLCFDAKGKRIAVSHYGGASLWFTASKSDTPRRLEWKGSHIGVVLHPEGEALVTAMQENELHGWRLSDGHNMRMSGYPSKCQSMAFSRNGRWLATGGAEAIVLWPFFGGGPMGKAPTELAGVPDAVAVRVAFHPQHDIVAAGFSDGTVLMSDVGTKRVLPVCGAGRGAVSALSFDASGTRLAFGTESGAVAVVDLSAKS